MPLSDCLLDRSLSRNIDQDPWVWALFLGSSPNRGQSPVEWVDFLSVPPPNAIKATPQKLAKHFSHTYFKVSFFSEIFS